LTRWFNYNAKVVDLPLLERQASFDAPLDSSSLVIRQVEQSANLKFVSEGQATIFKDAGDVKGKKK
jgi:hypothetical protein